MTAPDTDMIVAARAALDKKAEGLALLDLRGLSDVTDYFLICHGRSGRQVQSIADQIETALRLKHRRPGHVEGYARGEWVLMDYFDFVVHIFTMDRRSYYGLERLWGDAPRLRLPRPGGTGPKRRARAKPGDADREEE